MTPYRRRQLELRLIVRRADQDGLVTVPVRRPPDRQAVSPAGTSGREDSRYVLQEQTRSRSRREQ
jgi:hypothetical protein